MRSMLEHRNAGPTMPANAGHGLIEARRANDEAGRGVAIREGRRTTQHCERALDRRTLIARTQMPNRRRAWHLSY
jgi:hypothetical protein